jgi:small-conductance mechanosensitive channel
VTSPHLPFLAAQSSDELGTVEQWLLDLGVPEWLSRFGDRALEILFVLVLAWLASHLARRAVAKAVEEMKDPDNAGRLRRFKSSTRLSLLEGERPRSERRTQRADALGALAKSLVSVLVWIIALFTVLGTVGVELGPLIASAGVVGVALGFGAQTLVKDLISGVFMLVEDQYGVGDVIDAGDAVGVVEGVGLRSTRIRSVDGTLWHVPNGEIRRVGNMSQQWARALLDIGVAYDTDVDRASEVILEVATTMAEEDAYSSRFLDAPEIWGIQNLGADSVDIRLVIKTLPGEQWAISRELRARIKKAFDTEAIEIPFPQRTIWVRSQGGAQAPGLTPAAEQDDDTATSSSGGIPSSGARSESGDDATDTIGTEED